MPIAKPNMFDPAAPVAPDHGGEQFYGNLSARLQQFTNNVQNLSMQGMKKERDDALTAYSAEALLELSEQLPALNTRARDETQDDGLTPLERFDAGASGLRTGMLQNAPAIIREDLAAYIDQQLVTSRGKLATDLATKDRATAKTMLLRSLDTLADNAASAYTRGDDDTAELEASTWETLFKNGITSGLLDDPKETDKLAQSTLARFRKSAVMGGFNAAYDEGNALQYIKAFADAGVPQGMAPEEFEDIWKQMEADYSRLTKHNDEEHKRLQRERTERHQEGERLASLAIFRGEDPDLETLLERDVISDEFALKQQQRAANPGPAFDDEFTHTFYRLNLLAYSEDEIMADDDLTYSTRADLVEARRELVEDEENWRGTQQGTEAARRVLTSVGLPSGIMVSGMSSAMKLKANQALTSFYNQVDALPLEQRAMKAIEIADKVVKEVERDDALDLLPTTRTKLAEAENSLAGYDEGSWQHNTEKGRVERLKKRIAELERKAAL